MFAFVLVFAVAVASLIPNSNSTPIIVENSPVPGQEGVAEQKQDFKNTGSLLSRDDRELAEATDIFGAVLNEEENEDKPEEEKIYINTKPEDFVDKEDDPLCTSWFCRGKK